MISKELLSEVLNDKKILLSKNDLLIGDNVLLFDNQCNYLVNTNIYELAHKCKEWAFSKGFVLKSYKKQGAFSGTYHYAIDINDKICEWLADTEYEAIFKACEWIMERTK